MKLLYKNLFILFITLLIIKISESQVGFGSYQFEKIIEIENKSFYNTKILVWNSGKKDIKLLLEIIKNPNCLEVFIDKKELILSENPKDNYEIIILNDREIRAVPINIYFYIKEKNCEGQVIIKAISESLEKPEISVKQERDFVYLIKKVVKNEIDEEKKDYFKVNEFINQVIQFIEDQKINLLPIITIIFSIIVSLIIIIFSRKHK